MIFDLRGKFHYPPNASLCRYSVDRHRANESWVRLGYDGSSDNMSYIPGEGLAKVFKPVGGRGSSF